MAFPFSFARGDRKKRLFFIPFSVKRRISGFVSVE
jgi:hypothetical protein